MFFLSFFRYLFFLFFFQCAKKEDYNNNMVPSPEVIIDVNEDKNKELWINLVSDKKTEFNVYDLCPGINIKKNHQLCVLNSCNSSKEEIELEFIIETVDFNNHLKRDIITFHLEKDFKRKKSGMEKYYKLIKILVESSINIEDVNQFFFSIKKFNTNNKNISKGNPNSIIEINGERIQFHTSRMKFFTPININSLSFNNFKFINFYQCIFNKDSLICFSKLEMKDYTLQTIFFCEPIFSTNTEEGSKAFSKIRFPQGCIIKMRIFDNPKEANKQNISTKYSSNRVEILSLIFGRKDRFNEIPKILDMENYFVEQCKNRDIK